ncbi:CASP8 and FADD-like apoptosis regulator [Megalops cyprinoides]|uniref:CASP8 and FADD-like apoptosis regulator n=1 Tax=Megalops cyprinoides TaxID=118141 RepID=UPI001863B52F|nr:CASP8 and FADD-like apoptosis regulator [Megalops cyprinoides]XP_036396957.1 CASP8 and FADD-like apoptosis regulator [Megalops cyprinoides]
MADGQLCQTINRIAEELSLDESRRLVYLCGDLAAHCCVGDVKGTLKSLMSHGEVDQMFLLELMFRMGRFDILKKVLRANKKDVEGMLGTGCVVSEYRVLMADVSEDMDKEELRSLIFLLSGTVPKGRLDNATCFLDVVVELEMLDKISCEKVDLIYECLSNIHRLDLAKKVEMYQNRVAGPKFQPNFVQRPVRKQQGFTKFPPPVTPSAPPVPSVWHRLPKPHAPENMKFSVPETGWQYCQGAVDMYRMRADPRGVCVIVDCVGSDGDMLEQTFSHLRFRVILHKWLSVEETLSALREVSRSTELRGADAFACCILSRATDTDLLATETQGRRLRLDTVRHLFTTEACPALAGKPKLFFLQCYSVPEPQACRGFRDEDLETDGPAAVHRVQTIPNDADLLWSLCKTDSRQLESIRHRSVYLQALSTSLLKGQTRGKHLVDILTEVNGVIYEHNQKNPEEMYHVSLRHTLRKNLFI